MSNERDIRVIAISEKIGEKIPETMLKEREFRKNIDIKVIPDKQEEIKYKIPAIFANFICFPARIKPMLKKTTRTKSRRFKAIYKILA